MNKYITILLAICFSHFAFAQVTVPLRFDKYYTYAEVVEAIKALNKTYPDLTQTVLVGKSEENREIWALEINNPKTGNSLDKPGVYVDGNIHGNEIQAAEVALYFADYLLKNYGKIPDYPPRRRHNDFPGAIAFGLSSFKQASRFADARHRHS